MSDIMKIDTVQQYNDYFGVETCHPLVSIIEGSKAKPLRYGRKLYGVYAVLLKDAVCGSLKYGQSIYDYQRGTMLLIAPGQVMGSEDDGRLDIDLPSRISARHAAGGHHESVFLLLL